jgi:ferredoxin
MHYLPSFALLCRLAFSVRAHTTLRRFTMAYTISSDCILCGACEAECPVNAISEGDGIFVVNPQTCIDCGACASVCPVGAPSGN